jgi:hypothetical protein
MCFLILTNKVDNIYCMHTQYNIALFFLTAEPKPQNIHKTQTLTPTEYLLHNQKNYYTTQISFTQTWFAGFTFFQV